MADTFTNDLRLRLQESGANSGQWGSLLNDTITNIASAFSLGSEAIPNASTHTITLADDSSSQDEARSLYLKCTGGGQACTVTLAPNTISKVWIISNETSFTLTFSAGSGANVAVAAGAVKVIVTDGAGSGAAVVDAFTDLQVNGLTSEVDGNTAALTVRSTDADSQTGPLIVFDRASASPADDDLIGRVLFRGKNDAAQDTTYARIHSKIQDATDGTEDGIFELASIVNGTVVNRIEINATETVFNQDSNDIDLRVESDGNDSMLVVNAGGDRVHIGSASALSVGSNMDFTIQGQDGGAGASIVRNSADTNGPSIQFGKSRGTAANATTVVQEGDGLGVINFRGADGTDLNTISAQVLAQVDGTPGSNAMPGRLIFKTNDSSGTAATEVFRIDSNQTAHFGTTDGAAINNAATRVNISGASRALDVYRSSSSAGNIVFAVFSDVGGTKTKVFEVEANGDVENATGSYGTISDQRLKQDIVNANSQWSDIKALQIRNFKFINDVTQNGENALRQIGVVAQELESSGMTSLVKTRVDEATGEEVKSVKTTVLFMKAVKALQEAITRIETLEAEVTALKGGS